MAVFCIVETHSTELWLKNNYLIETYHQQLSFKIEITFQMQPPEVFYEKSCS